jgi:hypothetical protein
MFSRKSRLRLRRVLVVHTTTHHRATVLHALGHRPFAASSTASVNVMRGCPAAQLGLPDGAIRIAVPEVPQQPCGPRASITAAVFTRHGLHGGHELQMLALGIVDQRHGWAPPCRPEARSRRGGSCPVSTTATWCVARRRSRGQGHADVIVEVALGRQRGVALSRPSGSTAIICVTVVLPLLPVTAISGRLELACRHAPASTPSAAFVSGTTMTGQTGLVPDPILRR